jgi:hypothetical protein
MFRCYIVDIFPLRTPTKYWWCNIPSLFVLSVCFVWQDPRGPGRIWTAGEPEHDARTEKLKAGGFMIPPALQKDMRVSGAVRARPRVICCVYAKFVSSRADQIIALVFFRFPGPTRVTV